MGIFFNFIARIVIARFYTPDDYGLFNLFFSILSILVAVAVLGLGTGMPRFIGYYTGTEEKDKIKAVEGWGLLIGIVSGFVFSTLLFFLAPWVAPIFSKENIFIDYLRIAAITLPFFVLLNSLITIFRGHQHTKERILFYDFGMNITFLIFSLFVGIFSLPFIGVIWSMFVAISAMSMLLLVYYLKKQKSLLKNVYSFTFNPSLGKTILIFSLPLLLVDILKQLMGWTSTLMIGSFLTAQSVGFYEVARPLSMLISTGLNVNSFIYAPLVATLYSQHKVNENREIYSILTKWICFVSLPLAMVLFFFSDVIITTLFGVDYLSAGIPLKILSIIFFIDTMTGPDGYTLTAYGKTKFLMYATALAVIILILLNLYLIPKYGIIGAAIATGFSVIIINIVRITKLYKISGIHSLRSENLKPIFSTLFFGSIIAISLSYVPIPKIYSAIITFVLLSILYLIMMLFTHSVSKQDINILKLIEKKFGVNLSSVEKLFTRFVR